MSDETKDLKEQGPGRSRFGGTEDDRGGETGADETGAGETDETGADETGADETDETGADEADEAEEDASFGQALWAALREIVIVVGMAMVLSFIVKTWLLQAFYIPSGSMENTLVRDDRVVVSKLTPGPIDLARGDIVVFEDPANWLQGISPVVRTGAGGALHTALVFVGLLPDDSDNHLIKRVIGLPGDRVACCDANGKVMVNGASLTEPYVRPGDTPNGDRPPFDILVPKDRVWVMGDHRSDSSDSRLHDDGTGRTGSVPIERITGRAVTVVWPIDRVTWLSVTDRVFGSVPPAGSSATTPPPTGSPAP